MIELTSIDRPEAVALLGAMWTIICAIWGVGMYVNLYLCCFSARSLKQMQTYFLCRLGMPASFVAGGWLSILYLLIITAFNLYATVGLSRTLIDLPEAKTYARLGSVILGKPGFFLVITLHYTTILLFSIILLVTAGDNLNAFFKNYWEGSLTVVWMAVALVVIFPFLLLRGMREVVGVAIVGFLMSLVTYIIVVVEIFNAPVLDFVASEPTWRSITSSIGVYTVSFGTAIIVPAIHRDMENTRYMPIAVGISLSVVALSYVLIGAIGYAKFGCYVSGSILQQLPSNAAISVANLTITLHVIIALVVYLNPLFFQLERFVFKLCQPRAMDRSVDTLDIASPVSDVQSVGRHSFNKSEAKLETQRMSRRSTISEPLSRTSMFLSAVTVFEEDDMDSSGVKLTKREKLISVAVRATLSVIIFIISAMPVDFVDLLTLVGNLTVNLISLIVPIVLYMVHFKEKISRFEKVFGCIVVIICAAVGCLGVWSSIENIIENSKGDSVIHLDGDGQSCDQETGVGCTYPLCPVGLRELPS